MTIDLSVDNLSRWYFRILYRGANASWDDPWIVVKANPQAAFGKAPSSYEGFVVERFTRAALPSAGEATFSFRYGQINGRKLSPFDLHGADIRIQATRDTGDLIAVSGEPDNTPWETVFWGTVESQSDDLLNAKRTYQCIDALASRMRGWAIDRHWYSFNNTVSEDSITLQIGDNPGFNVPDSHGRAMGNRGSGPLFTDGMPLGSYSHCFPGKGDQWSDADVLLWLLRFKSASGGAWPVDFQLSVAAQEALSSAVVRRVAPGMTAWDIFGTIVNRRRGRGVFFLDWLDDSSDPTGEIIPSLQVLPQAPASVTYIDPVSQAQATIPGASSTGSLIDVDLAGDHRLLPGSLSVPDVTMSTVEQVITESEPIESLITLSSLDNSFDRRFADNEQIGYLALDPGSQGDRMIAEGAQYAHVFRLFGPPFGWDFQAGSADGASKTRCDYRMRNDGSIAVPDETIDTSILSVQINRDLPLYQGVDYSTATPVKYDAANESPDLQRQHMLVIYYDDNDKWNSAIDTHGIVATVQGTDMTLIGAGDQRTAARSIADGDLVNRGERSINWERLSVTVGLLFRQHRVRMAASLDDDGNIISSPDGFESPRRRTKTVKVSDYHLWLAHPQAIWSWKDDRDPVRGCAGSTPGDPAPGVIRDDRSSFARTHYQMSAWYLGTHRKSSWEMRAMGAVRTDTDTGNNWPQLGQVVSSITYTDRRSVPGIKTEEITEPINTPVTMIAVNVIDGITRFTTEWMEI